MLNHNKMEDEGVLKCKADMNLLCVCVLIAQSCPTLWDPKDCSPQGCSVHGIFQARILEWVAIPSSKGSSQPKDWSWVSSIADRFFTILDTREAHFIYSVRFSSVQLLSPVWLFATPWAAACQASLSITNSWRLLKPMSIESVMPSNHLILCLPLLPPLVFHSIRVFSNESVPCIRWLKY